MSLAFSEGGNNGSASLTKGLCRLRRVTSTGTSRIYAKLSPLQWRLRAASGTDARVAGSKIQPEPVDTYNLRLTMRNESGAGTEA